MELSCFISLLALAHVIGGDMLFVRVSGLMEKPFRMFEGRVADDILFLFKGGSFECRHKQFTNKRAEFQSSFDYLLSILDWK